MTKIKVGDILLAYWADVKRVDFSPLFKVSIVSVIEGKPIGQNFYGDTFDFSSDELDFNNTITAHGCIRGGVRSMGLLNFISTPQLIEEYDRLNKCSGKIQQQQLQLSKKAVETVKSVLGLITTAPVWTEDGQKFSKFVKTWWEGCEVISEYSGYIQIRLPKFWEVRNLFGLNRKVVVNILNQKQASWDFNTSGAVRIY